jgi:hypothetical protein
MDFSDRKTVSTISLSRGGRFRGNPKCLGAHVGLRHGKGQSRTPVVKAPDLRLAWSYTIRYRFVVQPSVGFCNLFNFANFDPPGNMLSGLLTGATGQINGTTPQGHNVNRVGVGTGVYSLGAPRQIEFSLRLTF